LPDVFSGTPSAGGSATVCHGPYLERLPVTNMTVRDIRDRFRDRLDIDPESQAFVDGNEADEDTVIRDGQLVTFIRRAGEKGNVHVFI